MKTISVAALAVLLLCLAIKSAVANDYKTVVITSGTNNPTVIDVPGDRFLVIRTFTQSGGTTRGLVTLTMLDGQAQTTNILSASFVPANNTTAVEPVNSVVIAGPATISVNCQDTSATCFLTYRKEAE